MNFKGTHAFKLIQKHFISPLPLFLFLWLEVANGAPLFSENYASTISELTSEKIVHIKDDSFYKQDEVFPTNENGGTEIGMLASEGSGDSEDEENAGTENSTKTKMSMESDTGKKILPTISVNDSSSTPTTPVTVNITESEKIDSTITTEIRLSSSLPRNKDFGDLTQLQERLRNEDDAKQQFSKFFVPGLALVVLALICLMVFCIQFVHKEKKYQSSESSEDTSKRPQSSFLPGRTQTSIVTEKYPDEQDSCQKERLMSDEFNQNNVEEGDSSNSHNSDDTVDCCKLLEESKKENDNSAQIKITVAKVTTLPDSIPKKADMRIL